MQNLQENVCVDTSSLDLLIERVDCELKNSENYSHSVCIISEYLKEFGISNMVKTLRDILLNPSMISEIANRSYLHGNGFYKIILHDCDDFRIRLHVWRAGTYAEENVHNHRWYFGSTILTGVLCSEIWKDSKDIDTQKYKEYRYYGLSKDNKVLHTLSSETPVELSEFVTYKSGDAYHMTPDKLHRIVGTNNILTSTLLCQTKITEEFSRTIIIKDHIPTGEHVQLSTQELRDIITEYLSFVDNND